MKKETNIEPLPQPILLSAETMGKDLLGLIIQELKAAPKVWQQMSELEQNQVLDRARTSVQTTVESAIGILHANGCVSVIADIEGVAIKDHIKVILKVSRSNPGDAMQELFGAHNQPCRIVLASAANFTSGMEEVKGESDQRALELTDAQTDNTEANDDPLICDAIKFCRETNKASISSVQRHLKIGYTRAAKLIISLEDKGLISSADAKGARTVFPVPE